MAVRSSAVAVAVARAAYGTSAYTQPSVGMRRAQWVDVCVHLLITPDRTMPHDCMVHMDPSAVLPTPAPDETPAASLDPSETPGELGKRPAAIVEVERRIRPHLESDEPLIARRTEATVMIVVDDGTASVPIHGALYLTDRRLLHLSDGPDTREMRIDLRDVNELSATGERRLLFTLRGVRGLIIDLESPIEFRAQVAMAISALRGRQWEPQSPSR